jgi:AcrR family transcriptional regulator
MEPREKILQAALGLLAREGVRSLTQPRVARAAGMRQSHLTYYFPKKKDLVEAVLTHIVEGMASHLREAVSCGLKEGLRTLYALIVDPIHMRMFTGLAVEASADEELRELLAASVHRSDQALAQLLGRDPGDPEVQQLVATLWGMGLRRMLTQQPAKPQTVELLIRRFEEGVKPSRRRSS